MVTGSELRGEAVCARQTFSAVVERPKGRIRDETIDRWADGRTSKYEVRLRLRGLAVNG